MKTPPVEYVYVGLLALGVLLWFVALARGRALEWFSGASQLPPWHLPLSEFAAFAASFLVGGVGGQVLAVWAFALDVKADPVPARTVILAGCSTQLGWLAACALFSVPRFLRPPAGRMNWVPAAVAGCVGFILFLPAGAAVGQVWKFLLPQLGLSDSLQSSVTLLKNIRGAGEFLALAGMVVVLAPVVEEWAFRRLLYRFLAGHLPEWSAMAISAVLFGLLHLNAGSFLPLVALGVALCLAYRYTGRMITPILMHAAFNLNTLVYVVMSTG